jgi:hypothetical protein
MGVATEVDAGVDEDALDDDGVMDRCAYTARKKSTTESPDANVRMEGNYFIMGDEETSNISPLTKGKRRK